MKTSTSGFCGPPLLALLVLACGAGNFNAGNDWNPHEEMFFDDGVDIVEDFSDLSSTWADKQEQLFERRVQMADMVAIVDVKSVQSVLDSSGEAARRIDVNFAESLYGISPNKTIQLFSAKEATGHELILRYETRLIGKFLVFIRWFKGENREVKHHFHLSPASKILVEKAKTHIMRRKLNDSERKS